MTIVCEPGLLPALSPSTFKVLDPSLYRRITPLLGGEFNPIYLPTLSAVTEGHASATVLVDRCDRPTRAVVALAGGWVFPLGPADDIFARHTIPTLLAQCDNAYPLFAIWPASADWERSLSESYALSMSRIHFTYMGAVGERQPLSTSISVSPIDFGAMASITEPIDPWLPGRWNGIAASSPTTFGYCVTINGELASAAWAGLVGMRVAQFDVVTNPAHIRKGYGEAVCRALLDHCAREKLVPYWSTDVANTPSFHLALKLGFAPSSKSAAYVWCRDLPMPCPKWGSEVAEISVNSPGSLPAVRIAYNEGRRE